MLMVTPASLSSLFVLAIFDRCGQTGRALRSDPERIEDGAVAQLGEHLLCKQGVSGSIPLSSTIFGTGAPDDRRRPLALRSLASFECQSVGWISLEKK
jgi:hypothetical protein